MQRKAEVRAQTGLAVPDRRTSVFGGEDGDTGRAECLDDGAVLARGGLHRLQEFLVLALRVVDQGNGRLGNGSQRRDLAGMVHAQLDDRRAVPS